MKLSCLPVSFFSELINGTMSVAEWACIGRKARLDAVDLSVLFIPDRSLRTAAQIRRQIEAEGMQVAMLTTYPDFTHPDPTVRQEELERGIHAVQLAAELGAQLVRVTAGQAHPQTGLEEGIAWAIEGLTRLKESTAETGISLVYENHAKPGVWQYTDFSQPPEIFLKISEGTAGCGLGINFDTGNASAYSDDPVALLERVIDRVISVHASDTAKKGELRHVLLGTGVTPYRDLFAVLKQAHWDGWICMEEASFQGPAGVEAAADFIRKTWNEL